MVAEFAIAMDSYRADVLCRFRDCLESLELDGAPVLDGDNTFIEFELYLCGDFCTQASPRHEIEVFEFMG